MIKCRKLHKAWASSSLKVRAGLARLGDKLKIPAGLDSGSKASGIFELSSARARKEVGFPSYAQLELGHKSGFELGSSSGSKKNSWLNTHMVRVEQHQLSLLIPIYNNLFIYSTKRYKLQFCRFGSLQTILLCVVGELAGGGSVAVAVGASDMWQVT